MCSYNIPVLTPKDEIIEIKKDTSIKKDILLTFLTVVDILSIISLLTCNYEYLYLLFIWIIPSIIIKLSLIYYNKTKYDILSMIFSFVLFSVFFNKKIII